MSDLKPQPLFDNPEYNTSPSGMGSISKFDNYQFGGTFSRVLRIVHETVVVDADPDSGSPRANVGSTRVRDCVIYGRICDYPNVLGTDWQTLEEEEPLDDLFGIGRHPFVTYKYVGTSLVFHNTLNAPSIGDKVVVQLLFAEL